MSMPNGAKASAENTEIRGIVVLDNLERPIDDEVNSYKAMCRIIVFFLRLVQLKLNEFAYKETGLDQYAIEKFAESFEMVPRTLVENAGLNVSDDGGNDIEEEEGVEEHDEPDEEEAEHHEVVKEFWQKQIFHQSQEPQVQSQHCSISQHSGGQREERHARYFVAVHVGAGYHASCNGKAYKKLMRRACLAATSILSQGFGRSLDAIAAAITILEDDKHTNARRGSNLTKEGHVESDASIMDGLTGAFGAVEGIPRVQNPFNLQHF